MTSNYSQYSGPTAVGQDPEAIEIIESARRQLLSEFLQADLECSPEDALAAIYNGNMHPVLSDDDFNKANDIINEALLDAGAAEPDIDILSIYMQQHYRLELENSRPPTNSTLDINKALDGLSDIAQDLYRSIKSVFHEENTEPEATGQSLDTVNDLKNEDTSSSNRFHFNNISIGEPKFIQSPKNTVQLSAEFMEKFKRLNDSDTVSISVGDYDGAKEMVGSLTNKPVNSQEDSTPIEHEVHKTPHVESTTPQNR